MKAAIYTRVSTREQAVEGYSLDAQRSVLTEYCHRNNYEIYNIYSAEGISAKDITHRPALLQLLKDADNHCFGVILVWKLTRFSRNLADLTVTCEKLDKAGISLVSYSEAFDSKTPAGRMIRSMLGTVAQFEREITGENVSITLHERARKGKRTCNEILGYDLSGTDSFTINPKEAEYVNYVHDQYIVRKSLTEVTALAKEKGFHGKRGQEPTSWAIFKILTCPVYAGYNSFKGKLYKGNHEPIRTVQQYNKVQKILIRQGKLTGRNRKYKIRIIPEK